MQPLWRTVWRFLKTKNRTIKHFRFWVLIFKNMETTIWKDICTPMFMEALFTIAKTWKELTCPSVGEWIKKMCYVYTMEYSSAIKEKEILLLQHMGGTWGHYAKWNKLDRERQIPYHLMYMWNLKKNQKSNKLMDTENWFVVPRGGELGHGQNGQKWSKGTNFRYKINQSWGCNVHHGD